MSALSPPASDVMEHGSNILCELRAASIGHGRRALFENLNVRLEAGRFYLLCGPNGGGKSTYLRTVARLQPPLAGNMQLADGVTSAAMLQRAALTSLLPMRVRDVVLGGGDRGWNSLIPMRSRSQREAARRRLSSFDLDSLGRNSFHALSDGQKERTMVARTLVSSADILLFDEPTSAMDRQYTTQTFATLREEVEARPCAVVVATHDVEAAWPHVTDVIFADWRSNTFAISERDEAQDTTEFERIYGSARLLPNAEEA